MKVGLENILEGAKLLPEGNIGLITNHTGVTKSMDPGFSLLGQEGHNIAKIFTPEHGFFGFRSAGEEISNVYGKSNDDLEFISLYGDKKAPSSADLRDLDLLLYDIQDIGVRFYTYIYTLANSMRAAGESNVPLWVLDRPDPLGGDIVRGATLPPDHHTFVGDYCLPIRYGLTPGELSFYLRDKYGLGEEISAVTMEGWSRKLNSKTFPRPWVPPSSNIPDPETAKLYPGTCLLEGTNLSEGRGTTLPFKVFGAPWLEASKLRPKLEELTPSSIVLRETKFRPTCSKHEGEVCSGFQLHSDSLKPRSVEFIGSLFWFLRNEYPNKFQWRKIDGDHVIDRLLGGPKFRTMLEEDKSLEEVLGFLTEGSEVFKSEKERYHLYPRKEGDRIISASNHF